MKKPQENGIGYLWVPNGLHLVDLSRVFEQRKLEEDAWDQRHLEKGQGGKQVVSPEHFGTAAQAM